MNRFEFYGNLNKFKQSQTLKHSNPNSNYGNYYNKIDNYYSDGTARYFTKAEWDAYVENQKRNKYEEDKKKLTEAKKSTGASAQAIIDADARNKWEKTKDIGKKSETKTTSDRSYNAEKAQKEADERTKWEAEQKKKLEDTWNKKKYEVKKEMQSLANTFEKNRELPNVAPDSVLGMIKGQTDKVINDLNESGIIKDEDVQKAIAEKKDQFLSFLTDNISPELDSFISDKIKDIQDEKTIKEILEDEGKKYIDEFFEKHQDTIDKIKKEYEDIYGIVDDLKDGDYKGMAYTAMKEVYNRVLKDKFENKFKSFTQMLDDLDTSDNPPEEVMWLVTRLTPGLLGLFNGQGLDGFEEKVGSIVNEDDKIGKTIDAIEEKTQLTKKKQDAYARKMSKNGQKIEEEYRKKEQERKKSKTQKILAEELEKGMKYALGKIK